MSTEHANPDGIQQELGRILMEQASVRDPRDAGDFLRLVEDAALLQTEASTLLRTTISSARNAGATWQSIGRTLGMTKQAAQKRFAPGAAPHTAGLDPNERILGPTTTFDELSELALAGRYGWHSVQVGTNYHRMLHSDRFWEHTRVTMSPQRVKQLRSEGWELIDSGFPYAYLKRDTGLPAMPEPSA